MADRKVLIHISDRDKWNLAIGLATGLLDGEGESNLELIILADVFAGAVCVACDRGLKQQMIDLVERGQRILICEESIRSLNIPLKSLPDFTETVSLGLKKIIELQSEGFHYIKI